MKNNGHVARRCRVCNTRAKQLKDGLCPTCFDQADQSAYYEQSQKDSAPSSFWNRLSGWFTLFGRNPFGNGDEEDK